MLVLQANQEQEQTFNTLLQAMGEQVEWTGRFIVIDSQLILEGVVRSLVMDFDTKEILTNLFDLPIQEGQVLDIAKHPALQDLVNLSLYAFGKWGKLRGLRVEQDFQQLNQLFEKILHTYYIEPSYRKENFRFYKVGVRVTYEEVLETALQAEKAPEEEPGAEAQGLWHKLVWKNRERVFKKEETSLQQRQEDRIGNNFYLVGYQCPVCSQKLHMAVYPEGQEVRIDTEEKGVYLARAYTCRDCCCFYTPRPGRLIAEGIIYEMAFEEDTRAYEDYLELMGHAAQRTANFKYNEYEALRNQRLEKEGQKTVGGQENPDILLDADDALKQMETFSRQFGSLPDHVFRRFAHRVEEGFYPDTAVRRHEKQIRQQIKERGMEDLAAGAARHMAAGPGAGQAVQNLSGGPAPRQPGGRLQPAGSQHAQAGDGQTGNFDSSLGAGRAAGQAEDALGGRRAGHASGPGGTDRTAAGPSSSSPGGTGRMAAGLSSSSPGGMDRTAAGPSSGSSGGMGSGAAALASYNGKPGSASGGAPDASGRQNGRPGSTGSGATGPSGGVTNASNRQGKPSVADEKIEKYQARLGVLERLSERQKTELKKQIQNDPAISEYDKKALLQPIEEAQFKEKTDAVEKKVESSQSRSYAQIQKAIQDIEKEELPAQVKQGYLDRLVQYRTQRGAEEVRQVLENAPQRLGRAGYQNLEKKLQAYEGVDLSPYTETLRQKREAAEKQEITNIVRRSRKVSRGDYVSLMRRLEEQEFDDENVAPYLEKIEEKVRSLDEERLEELAGHAQQMDFNEAAAAYEQIDAESFLPELKSNALQLLSRRLEKIRTDECELLGKKLQDQMQGVIKENPRHHFYPARKVMLKTAEPEETRAIDAALLAYAADRDMFEYPIFSVDTSRNHSGREGMLLTPENLFYGTRLNSYGIPISSIASITASTGLLNRKINLEETNGARHKLPYAVSGGEMAEWAGILEEFIQYLQEKPASRKLNYLAKETHDTICCFRCGHVYQGRDVCPECGYKKNR